MTKASNVYLEGNTIYAKLVDAPKVAGEWWPGQGGYHWRPRRIVVTIRHGVPIEVELRGRALLPGHFLNVARYQPDQPNIPDWLPAVVKWVVRDAKALP